MRKYVVPLVAVMAVIAVIFAASAKRGSRDASRQAGVTAAGVRVEPAAGVGVRAKAGKGFDIPYELAGVKAAVAPYKVKADLSNVVNAKQFGKLTREQRALLAKNAFFAAPTDQQQLFYIYEQNDYKDIPSFITTDSVLQVYHIFYDFTLRNLENEKLYGILETLTNAMVKASKSVAGQMTDPKWKKAAEANQAYCMVAGHLMGMKTEAPSRRVESMVEQELSAIREHAGRSKSAIFEFKVDYSQFLPRGHYTRSEKLKRFFRTMMWYGYMPFLVGAEAPSLPHIRQSLLIAQMLFTARIDGKPATETWERIYEPTVFYVGAADDLTPYQYKGIMNTVFGPSPTYAQLQDESKLEQVYAELKKLPQPRIEVQNLPPGQHFKLMGQRYIPDSEMLQRLVQFPVRVWPKGLDVMAVLGSERAADVLDNVYKEPEGWAEYLPRRNKLLQEFSATPLDTWQSNLYWGWMWGLDSLLDPAGEGYPSFMRNQAWLDKGLNTSLGTWAELRHDTILYAKQSATAECGGESEEPPPPPKGYVEPNVEFYNRLLWLTKASRGGLGARGLLTEEMKEKFGDFEDLLTFLRNVSIKELTNQKLSRAEYDQIRVYGGNIERLTLSVIEGSADDWFSITNEADRDMAVIADVHTYANKCLEEGVGRANEILVVVPIEGRLYLTRGAIFSYYEFTHPSSDRLTDEKWQKMLKTGTAPPPPVWTKSFLSGTKSEIPIPRRVRRGSC